MSPVRQLLFHMAQFHCTEMENIHFDLYLSAVVQEMELSLLLMFQEHCDFLCVKNNQSKNL